MKRFIDLGSQITDNDQELRQFAFFDTIGDYFETFDQEQVWSSWDEFLQCYNDHYFRKHRSQYPQDAKDYLIRQLERRKSLCPEWVFENAHKPLSLEDL